MCLETMGGVGGSRLPLLRLDILEESIVREASEQCVLIDILMEDKRQCGVTVIPSEYHLRLFVLHESQQEQSAR